MPNLTAAQERAIRREGQLLVVAGAGAGKTSTLVERCFTRLTATEHPISPGQLLLVTFTKAAAAEMRRRLRGRLEEGRREAADPSRLAETIALLDSARISNLHVFCLDLVRENFHRLGLDPQVAALEEDHRRELMDRTLDSLLEDRYAKGGETRELVAGWVAGREQLIRRWVVKLHDYTQTLRRPTQWFEEQESLFQNPAPERWEKWWIEGATEWARGWRASPAVSPKAAALERLAGPLTALEGANSRAAADEPLRLILAARAEKGAKRPPKEMLEEAEFLASLVDGGNRDPLAEDWEWCRKPMLALLALARDFGDEFGRVKREMNALDFHDMEQFALRLLWNDDQSAVTLLAESWRARLELVAVDEYQDINPAQDAILQAVSRPGAAGNRFLVGDVKQAIYRFRLADPRLFLRYQHDWSGGGGGQVEYLSDNFRSHESILEFVNAFFRATMRGEIGGVDYTPEVELKLGDARGRPEHRLSAGGKPRVELLLRKEERKTGAVDEESAEDGAGDAPVASGVEAEALGIGRRLQTAREEGLFLKKEGRPVEWRDMVILLRAPSEKRAPFLKAFHQLGIPLECSRSGFLETMEVLDLENLLRVLDNPWQDLPLLAALRSPFGGFTSENLLKIRLGRPRGPFWPALVEYRARGKDESARARVARFLDSHERWRKRGRREALSLCLEAILQETFYREWIEAGDRAAERLANARKFTRMTREFDVFKREGLFRFLQFLDRRRELEAEIEPAFVGSANAVRLMSIHQSKGLEFPVVVAADLGKKFNLDDLKGEILLDDTMGLCPMTHPPESCRRYPSPALWLARRRQRRETLGEELRLLYVAMTRAREVLILSGAATAKKIGEGWGERAAGPPEVWIEEASSPMDWIGCWLLDQLKAEALPASGENALLSWRIAERSETPPPAPVQIGFPLPAPSPVQPDGPSGLDFEKLRALDRRLSWVYPHLEAEEEPAKTSVTSMRRRFGGEDEEEARAAAFLCDSPIGNRKPKTENQLSPVESGIAHHLFLQWGRLESLASVEGCRAEAERLAGAGVLSEAQAAVLDLEALAAFWQSDLGLRIAANPGAIRREEPFTARFEPQELARLGATPARPGLEGEFVVVQGVVDLAVVLRDETWLLDFKTDRLRPEDLGAKVAKYRPQIEIYARALQKAWARPVSEASLHFLSLGTTARLI
jgi:ATP-dependent helicase/nuclease subunit A